MAAQPMAGVRWVFCQRRAGRGQHILGLQEKPADGQIINLLFEDGRIEALVEVVQSFKLRKSAALV